MAKTINIFKNYLLNKSNQYRYYKSHHASLKQDNVKLEKEITALTHGYPPGHFYSPINDIDFLKIKEDEIWKPKLIEGIDLREKEQLDLFKLIVKYYPEFPFESKQPNLRYYPGNNMYGIGSAILLYSMIRALKPKKIIEVGSGFSSALMMDVNDLFFEKEIELTFIEPYPERLYSLMSEEDKNRNEVLDKIVQDVNLEKYKELGPNDILFIDSSYVVKTGSDVQHIIFKILPVLKSGVYIHFHDIFYPFEYPKNWVIDHKWSWNEDYFLRAFLMYNNQFQIALSTKYLYEYHNEVDYKGYDIGNSLWLKKG